MNKTFFSVSKGGNFLFISLSLFLFSIPAAVSAAWMIEAVDAPRFFDSLSSRAVAIDKISNQPHIVYGRDDLYHAYFDGTQWQYETVYNSPDTVSYVSLAIDSSNKIHIAYLNLSKGDLKYATNASGSWVMSVADKIYFEGAMLVPALYDFTNKLNLF